MQSARILQSLHVFASNGSHGMTFFAHRDDTVGRGWEGGACDMRMNRMSCVSRCLTWRTDGRVLKIYLTIDENEIVTMRTREANSPRVATISRHLSHSHHIVPPFHKYICKYLKFGRRNDPIIIRQGT